MRLLEQLASIISLVQRASGRSSDGKLLLQFLTIVQIISSIVSADLSTLHRSYQHNGFEAATNTFTSTSEKPSYSRNITNPKRVSFPTISDGLIDIQSIPYIKISESSWKLYMNFKESTCREGNDEYIANKVIHSMANRYFSWEERIFHIALRSIIFPKDEGHLPLANLIGSSFLTTLDPRIFISEPESLCIIAKNDPGEEELRKTEQDRFEDYLINKVFSHPLNDI